MLNDIWIHWLNILYILYPVLFILIYCHLEPTHLELLCMCYTPFKTNGLLKLQVFQGVRQILLASYLTIDCLSYNEIKSKANETLLLDTRPLFASQHNAKNSISGMTLAFIQKWQSGNDEKGSRCCVCPIAVLIACFLNCNLTSLCGKTVPYM